MKVLTLATAWAIVLYHLLWLPAAVVSYILSWTRASDGWQDMGDILCLTGVPLSLFVFLVATSVGRKQL